MKIITEYLDLIPEIDIKGICSPEEMLFFDIETTGLRKETTQLYLIGCVFLRDGKWQMRQWLAGNTSDEEYILEDFLDLTGSFNTLVHFNGERFDIPYIKYKADYYMIDNHLDNMKSFDIYLNARVCRNLLGLDSMSQKSLEVFLGTQRRDVYDGGKLIPVYYEYEKNGSEQLEELLLLHNHDDLTGMLQILSILSYRDLFDKNYSFLNCSVNDDAMVLDFRLKHAVPAARNARCNGIFADDVMISVSDDILSISIRITHTRAKMYFDNPSDYYYLPEQDMVIHKDLAKYTDRRKRTRATKNNCFVEKDGRFIPFFEGCNTKAFYWPDRKGKKLSDLEEISSSVSEDVFMNIACLCIDSITAR